MAPKKLGGAFGAQPQKKMADTMRTPVPRRDVATKPTFPIGKGGRRDIAITPKPRSK